MLGRDQRVFSLRGQNDNSHHRTNERSQRSKQIQITDVIRIDIMTYCFLGIHINDVEGLKSSGVDVNSVSQHVSQMYADMIFKFGYVHCDPHPGNPAANDDSTIVRNKKRDREEPRRHVRPRPARPGRSSRGSWRCRRTRPRRRRTSIFSPRRQG